jgi:alpha-1,6-mannosyltransferase
VRVVHVANAYTPLSGGIRTTVHALGQGYREAGHEFVLVVPGPRKNDEDLSWGRRITLAGPMVPGSGGYRVLADLRRVRAVLDALEPDRLEISDRLTLRVLGLWASVAGVPSTVIAHERVDGVLRAFSPLGERGARLAADRHNATTAQRFDRVVTTTGFAAQEFARIGIPTDHVPLGVDLERFRPAPRPQTGPRTGPQTGGVPLLVLCSRLSREKRPDLAVEALRVLHRVGCPARLVVAGSGPLGASLRRRARGLPVELVGHLADRSSVAGLLGSADVVLAPGPVETFGLAALEALACGTPVVAASTSAVAELVGGGAGRSARPEPVALAAAVASVLAVPEAHRRQASRTRAESYPWSRTTNAMLALHGLAVPETPGSPPERRAAGA